MSVPPYVVFAGRSYPSGTGFTSRAWNTVAGLDEQSPDNETCLEEDVALAFYPGYGVVDDG